MALIPRKLHLGDKIGIVSPLHSRLAGFAGPVGSRHGIPGKMGFEVVPGNHVRSTGWGYTASPQEKAEDIHRMFADNSIKAIICSQGGATANGCLAYLDWGPHPHTSQDFPRYQRYYRVTECHISPNRSGHLSRK